MLRAQFGVGVPWDEPARGFNRRGRRVPFLERAYGIYRAGAQRAPAALSLDSSFRLRRYQDQQTLDGVWNASQDGAIDNHFNRAGGGLRVLRVGNGGGDS